MGVVCVGLDYLKIDISRKHTGVRFPKLYLSVPKVIKTGKCILKYTGVWQ